MALSYALSTWPQLQSYMQTEVDDPTALEQAIDAVTVAIERYCAGMVFVQRTVTSEQHAGGVGGHRGGARRIHLYKYPIVSVTTIQDDQSTPATVAASNYTVISNQGLLEHDSKWPIPLYRWNITYEAGMFGTRDAVTEDLRLACNMQAADWLRNRQGSVVSESKGDDSRSFASGTGLLPQVTALLQPYRSRGI